MNATIEYKPIPNHAGYKAGSDGSIWSFWERVKMIGMRGGSKTFIGNEGKRLNPIVYTGGYLAVNLRGKKVYIHRAVLMAFRGLPEGKKDARHLDGNNQNNALENLEWASHRENISDKIKHGTVAKGERNGFAKLKSKDVDAIKQLVLEGKPKIEIAKQFGVCREHIYRIIKGELWNQN